jgi:hypothetical protein
LGKTSVSRPSTSSASRDFDERRAWAGARSLRDLLAGGERPDRETLVDWGSQLLQILAEAHAGGLRHRHLTEGEVFLTRDGRLILSGLGPPGPFPGGDDLYAAGCLLRRLAFAAGLRRGRGPGARDPLFKVLARATFADPAARYQSATEMAEAFREAGRTAVEAGRRHRVHPGGAGARVTKFPGPSLRPSAAASWMEDGAWHPLLLLLIALLLMAFLVATGWFIFDRDLQGKGAGLPSVSSAPHPWPPALTAR